MIHPWTWLVNFLSGPPPREIPCGCGDEFPDATCTRCMSTGLMPVSEEEYQAYQAREKARMKNLRKTERDLNKAVREHYKRLDTVYLIGCLDIRQNPPVVKEVYIRGDKAQSMTCVLNEEFLFDICSASGYSFDEARTHLLEGVKSMPRHFGWVRDLYIPKEELE